MGRSMATREKHSQNEIERLLEKGTPFVEKHGNKILLGMAALMLVAAVAIFVTRRSTASSAEGWTEMASASVTDDYASIADRFPQSDVGTWAKLVEADSYLSSALSAAFVDRRAAKDDIEQATKAYETLLNSSATSRSVRERALFGLAQTLEAGCAGDTSEVVAGYKKLLEEFPDSAFRGVVEERIASLGSSDAGEFYAWFDKQDPKPSDLQPPGDGTPGSPPSSIPELPITLPDLPPLLEIPGMESVEESAAVAPEPANEKADDSSEPESANESESAKDPVSSNP